MKENWINITGKNAQGKSNFLEAVSFLANGKSSREPSPASIPHDDTFWSIRGRIANALREASFKKGSLTLKSNGKGTTISEFMKSGGALTTDQPTLWRWFTTPDERRRFLDRLIFFLHPERLTLLQRFSRLMKERNKALRTGSETHLIDALTETFIESAADLNRYRREVVRVLSERLEPKIRHIPGPLRLHYPEASRDDYRRVAAHLRLKEERRGFSLFGPQREDLGLLVEKRPAHHALSLGQKKSLFILLHLAACETSGCRHLLVDDLDADLDGSHLEMIAENLKGSPVQKITTTLHARISDTRTLRVREGGLTTEEAPA